METLHRPDEGLYAPSPVRLSMETVARIAAARDDNKPPRERKFRAAQQSTGATGERPRTTENYCQCMAALVRVNGLEAYALLDSGSTTVSVTHDFAPVAKINTLQLENPV